MSLREDLGNLMYSGEVVYQLTKLLPSEVVTTTYSRIKDCDSKVLLLYRYKAQSLNPAVQSIRYRNLQNEVKKIYDDWLLEEDIRIRALIAFGSTQRHPQLFRSILFALPPAVIVKWNQLEFISSYYGKQLEKDFRNPDIGGSLITLNFLQTLWSESASWQNMSLPNALAAHFIMEERNTPAERLQAINDAMFWAIPPLTSNFACLKEHFIKKFKEEHNLVGVPDSWVEETIMS